MAWGEKEDWRTGEVWPQEERKERKSEKVWPSGENEDWRSGEVWLQEEREERRIMLFRVSIKRSFPGETLVAFYGRRRSIV